MDHRKNHMSIILAGLIFLVALSGCQKGGVVIGAQSHSEYRSEKKGGPPPWAPAHGYRAKHKYRYYPSLYVYFDIGREIYFYLEGDEWKVVVTLPKDIKIDGNKYVTLQMDSERPYIYHADVVRNYPPGQQKSKSKGKNKNRST
jgi:hypothetical protein